jgi:putative membrane protein
LPSEIHALVYALGTSGAHAAAAASRVRGIMRAALREEFAVLDLILAIVHHVVIFAIFGILFAEFMAVRPGMSTAAAVRIAAIDLWYGILAGAILVIGFCRAIYAAKGWAYYSHNAFFWAKMTSFAAIGLLSVPPTMEFIRWRKRGTAPDDAAIKSARRYLHAELGLFVLLLVFAALMARGYGEF